MSNSNIVPIVYSSFIDKFVTVKKNSYGSKDRLYKAAQAKWNELKANKPKLREYYDELVTESRVGNPIKGTLFAYRYQAAVPRTDPQPEAQLDGEQELDPQPVAQADQQPDKDPQPDSNY